MNGIHVLDRGTINNTQQGYSKGVTKTETAPADEYTVTPGGTVVPETTEWGGQYGSKDGFTAVEVFDVTEDGQAKKLGTFKAGESEPEKTVAQDTAPVEARQPGSDSSATSDRTTDLLDNIEEKVVKSVRSIKKKNKKVYVTLKGSFGEVVLPLIEAFTQGQSVVLVSDLEAGFLYTPPVSRESFTLTMPDGNDIEVVYPGVAFNRPESDERFTIMVKV